MQLQPSYNFAYNQLQPQCSSGRLMAYQYIAITLDYISPTTIWLQQICGSGLHGSSLYCIRLQLQPLLQRCAIVITYLNQFTVDHKGLNCSSVHLSLEEASFSKEHRRNRQYRTNQCNFVLTIYYEYLLHDLNLWVSTNRLNYYYREIGIYTRTIDAPPCDTRIQTSTAGN